MKRLLVTNRKGGVGKSTTALHLAYLFAQKGYRVLLIDMDPQGHLQIGLGWKKSFKRGIHSALAHGTLLKTIVATDYAHLDFIPANINYDLSTLAPNPKQLKRLLKKGVVAKRYDLCVIDTPPTSDVILNNAMLASDYVLVPMQTEYLGYMGVVQFLKLFYQTASTIHAKFTFLGVLPTLYNRSIHEHNEIIERLQERIGKERVLAPIRKDFNLSKAFMYGQPIFKSHPRSRGAKDYEALTKTIGKKIGLPIV